MILSYLFLELKRLMEENKLLKEKEQRARSDMAILMSNLRTSTFLKPQATIFSSHDKPLSPPPLLEATSTAILASSHSTEPEVIVEPSSMVCDLVIHKVGKI
jgi:hypothetical protein